MGTRLVRVKRQRPKGVVWAVSAMLIMLAVYLYTATPSMRVGYGPKGDEPVSASGQALAGGEAAQATEAPEQVTQEVQFEALDAYLIQFGAYDAADNARIEAARYVARGAAGYLLEDGKFRVIGAGYESREEAEKVKAQLEKEEGIDSYVYELKAGSVTLRVTATQPQIDALSAAERTLVEQNRAMGRLAYELDSGAVDAPGARSALGAMADAVRLAREQLAGVAGQTPNQVAAGLIATMAQLEESASQLSMEKNESTLDLSSKIKYNYVEICWSHARYLRGLTAQS